MSSPRREKPWRGLFYPPLAVRHVGNVLEPAGRRWWLLVCVTLFVPVAAALHHLIFFPHQCVLADTGYDYDPATLAAWLARDPSPAWAALAALGIHRIGLRSRRVRSMVAPVFVAFIPLSIYLWDIPFTGKAVCRLSHDGNLILFGSTALRTLHLYGLGAVVWAVLFGLLLVERRRFELREAGHASRPSARPRPRFPVVVQEPHGMPVSPEASPRA